MVNGIFQIVGSLGLFLYGMKIMSDGIQKAAGDRLQKIMNYVTINRYAAVFTGFMITAIIQSSSATTVMVVSFVNAQLLSLAQAIGVIMGANIGTTITGWIVALLGFKFHIAKIAIPAIGIGMPLILAKRFGKQNLGEFLVGFGLVFLGLNYLKDSVPDIKHNTQVLEFLAQYTDLGFFSTLIFIGVGTMLTIVVQSSSAAMAITLTMAYAGWIDYKTSAAIVLGENIGTTITAYLASIGTQVNARRAARAHTLFNLIGILWMLAVFEPFLKIVEFIVPGEVTAGKFVITSQLAMFHSLFNITNTCLLIWFIPMIEKLVTKIVKPKGEEALGKYELKYLSAFMQDTAELNLLKAKAEISKMAGKTEEMFRRFLAVYEKSDQNIVAEVERIKFLEEYTDQMQEQISHFLVACSKEQLNSKSAQNVNVMIHVVDELESIADCIYTLMMLCQRRYNKKIIIDEKALVDIKPYIDIVLKFITFNKDHLNEHLSHNDLKKAYSMEEEINQYRKKLKSAAQRRLQKGADVKAELLYIDMLAYIEKIGDYSLDISQALGEFY